MRTTAALVVALLAIAPLQLHGQGLTPLQAEELRKAKDEVFIRVAGAERMIHGLVTARTDETLTLTVDGRPYAIPMASVRRIDTMTKSGVKKGATIGAIVGAGVGAWCAFICGQGMDSESSVVPAVLTQFGIATAIGAVSGLGARGLKTIYSAATETQPYTGPLPCPATPLVVSAPLVVPDRAKWGEWSGDNYYLLGARRCDGVAIRRNNNETAGVWQSGVELKFKDIGNDVVTVTARVTAQIPDGNRDKTAVVLIEILDGAVVLGSATAIIEAETFKEVSVSQKLNVSSTKLAASINTLLRLTIVTSYD